MVSEPEGVAETPYEAKPVGQRGSGSSGLLTTVNAICTLLATIAALASVVVAWRSMQESRETLLVERRVAACEDRDRETVAYLRSAFATGLEWSEGYEPYADTCGADTACQERLRQRIDRIGTIVREGRMRFALIGPESIASAERKLVTALDGPVDDESFERIQNALTEYRRACAEAARGPLEGER